MDFKFILHQISCGKTHFVVENCFFFIFLFSFSHWTCNIDYWIISYNAISVVLLKDHISNICIKLTQAVIICLVSVHFERKFQQNPKIVPFSITTKCIQCYKSFARWKEAFTAKSRYFTVFTYKQTHTSTIPIRFHHIRFYIENIGLSQICFIFS